MCLDSTMVEILSINHVTLGVINQPKDSILMLKLPCNHEKLYKSLDGCTMVNLELASPPDAWRQIWSHQSVEIDIINQDRREISLFHDDILPPQRGDIYI